VFQALIRFIGKVEKRPPIGKSAGESEGIAFENGRVLGK